MSPKKRIVRGAVRRLAPPVTTRELREAALLGAARWAGRRVARSRRARSRARLAGTALLGAAIAVPLGYLLGRRLNADDA